MDGHAPLDVLEFHLSLDGAGPNLSLSSGEKALVQFANVSCIQDGSSFSFHTKDGSFLKADIEAGRTWGFLSKDLIGAPRYVFNDLLMAPLMEMLKQRGFFGLHAAALTKDSAGYLFPGNAESGKTTIALSLLKEGFQYLADDKVLLRKEDNGITALAFTRRFNIDPNISRYYPELGFLEDLKPLPGTTKRAFDISKVYPGTFLSRCRPKFLIHLHKTSELRSRRTRLSPNESFVRLANQTVPSLRKEITEKQLQLLADLARGTESHLLQIGEDLNGTPERFLELLPHT
ncbi:MAG: hypothetical protein RX318_02960 [bacterium]|nr:hypothetical protein [bacterium]